jgi:hypothetical protein
MDNLHSGVSARSEAPALSRDPDHHRSARAQDWQAAGIEAVTAIGDCLAPGVIVHAVYAGHRYARELDEPVQGEVCFRRRASEPPMQ